MTTTENKIELVDGISLSSKRGERGSSHWFQRAPSANGWWVTITIYQYYGFPRESRSWFSEEQAKAHFDGLVAEGATAE